MKQYKVSLATSTERAYEACLAAAPSAGFAIITHDESLRSIALSDDIIHGIEVSLSLEPTKPDACVAFISVTGSMEILAQPRRMKLVSEIKRYLRNQ